MRLNANDQLTFATATSIYEIDDQDIISNSVQCSLPQNSSLLPHTHSTDLLHWPYCLEQAVGTQSILRCHLFLSYLRMPSGSFTWAESWLILFTFFRKSSILICLKSQVWSISSRPLEISNLSAPASDAIAHYLRLLHYLLSYDDSAPGQQLLRIAVSLGRNSVSKWPIRETIPEANIPHTSSTQCRFCNVSVA